eukprot:1380598-Karenia_brevis.AAC.1
MLIFDNISMGKILSSQRCLHLKGKQLEEGHTVDCIQKKSTFHLVFRLRGEMHFINIFSYVKTRYTPQRAEHCATCAALMSVGETRYTPQRAEHCATCAALMSV